MNVIVIMFQSNHSATGHGPISIWSTIETMNEVNHKICLVHLNKTKKHLWNEFII